MDPVGRVRGLLPGHCRACGRRYYRSTVERDWLRTTGLSLGETAIGPAWRLALRGEGDPEVAVCPAGHEGYVEVAIAGRRERVCFEGRWPDAVELEGCAGPEGTGAELMATGSPAGTGSELIAAGSGEEAVDTS